jgi:ribosomal protein S18 acetylase RimI-like enzyme
MTSSVPTPFRLKPADAERYMRLRLRMLNAAPWAFRASPEDDEALDLAHLAKMLAAERYATFAIEAPNPIDSEAGLHEAHAHSVLVAAASITRAKQHKFAHRATIWGVFVEPAHRGKGLGRAVMTAAIALARTWPGVDFIDLGVSENSPEAQRLYESLGFEQWGREPEAIEHERRRYDEIYMTLRLGGHRSR